VTTTYSCYCYQLSGGNRKRKIVECKIVKCSLKVAANVKCGPGRIRVRAVWYGMVIYGIGDMRVGHGYY
jgi:hypothetical protein